MLRTRRERGAAFVESLIVICTILLCLFMVLWFQALYTAKLSTLQSARANAWTSALDGCLSDGAKGFEEPNTLLAQSARDSETTAAKGSSDSTDGDAAGLTADTQGESSPEWFALREGGEAVDSLDFSNFGKEGTMPVGTKRSFQCNERRNPEEFTLSAGDLLSNLASVMRDLLN